MAGAVTRSISGRSIHAGWVKRHCPKGELEGEYVQRGGILEHIQLARTCERLGAGANAELAV
jgi:hypothetical protein